MRDKKVSFLYTELILRKLANLDKIVLFSVLGLVIMGFSTLYSAAQGNAHAWLIPQFIKFSAFLPIMLVIALVDVRYILKYSYFLYALSLFFLALSTFKGYEAMGAQRWVRIGSISLQPSEPMKLFVIIAIARYFHYIHFSKVNNLFAMVPPLLLTFIPFALIIKQPDLGTSLVIIATAGALFFVTGIKSWKFIVVGIIALISVPFIWKFVLHDYQKQRVETFINPEKDPLGSGYNIIQSKIAIGSGGLFGKGFGEGSQSQLSFLPEKQTDFIFTMIAEELGFVGAITLISLYTILIFRILAIAFNCRNHFGRLAATGIAVNLFIHFFVNIAMVMGLLPVVGLPLPLISYGGTITVTTLLSIGVILNIALHSEHQISRVNSKYH